MIFGLISAYRNGRYIVNMSMYLATRAYSRVVVFSPMLHLSRRRGHGCAVRIYLGVSVSPSFLYVSFFAPSGF